MEDTRNFLDSIKDYQKRLSELSINIEGFIEDVVGDTPASFGTDMYELRNNLNQAKKDIDSAIRYIKYTRAILEF